MDMKIAEIEWQVELQNDSDAPGCGKAIVVVKVRCSLEAGEALNYLCGYWI